MRTSSKIIGQKSILSDSRFVNQFPRFTILIGGRGSGKTALIKELAKLNDMPIVMLGHSVNDMRDMIAESSKSIQNAVYIINEGQKLSMQAKNSILKTTEEPHKGVHIVLEIDSPNSIMNTLISRATVIYMDNYTQSELREAAEPYFDKSEVDDVIKHCHNVGDVIKYSKSDFKELLDLSKSFVSNISDANLGNGFIVTDKLRTKKEGEGHDPSLFLDTVISIVHQDKVLTSNSYLETRKWYDFIEDCQIAKNYLRSRSANIEITIDDLIIKLTGSD